MGDGSGTDTTRSATLNVALVGTGGLVKDDVGTLVLRGTNTYTGGTTVKAGVLVGDTVSLRATSSTTRRSSSTRTCSSSVPITAR
ncbi:autotransporter-associated beta strand repeat-containing protein [Variovorax boronicumulans]|uniref:autotransporter-associated beta strand repeat-containing protein n=1 Tax=Variovorax boronicumulans TaxID=436515 RepID=UPI0012FE3CA1|nr:autotransporter-associated beta strand repeat-containing protein [Variovorax boronicumulans]